LIASYVGTSPTQSTQHFTHDTNAIKEVKPLR